jgi:hypothetical protein
MSRTMRSGTRLERVDQTVRMFGVYQSRVRTTWNGACDHSTVARNGAPDRYTHLEVELVVHVADLPVPEEWRSGQRNPVLA